MLKPTEHRLMDHLLSNGDALLAELDRDWLEEYDWLQERLPEIDVAEDKCFRSRFMLFYKCYVGRGVIDDRPFQDAYFGILESEKDNCSVSFAEVLKALPLSGGKVQFSFASKLVATVNPNNPVYDNNVQECLRKHNLGLRGRRADDYD